MKKVLMLGALTVAASHGAQAVDFKAGDWNVSLGGIVNAYYTQVSCSGDAVGGLALASKAVGCGGQDQRTTIGNGLLPNGLVTSATSHQGDYDIKALIGIYNATATDSAIAANSGVDVRQAYFTFGNADMGTVKLGRDNGIFGGVIFTDMTLIGAGAPVQATQRGRVTLGHIGAGYSYVGYYGQIAYSAPKNASGIGFDAAVLSPVSDTPIVTAPAYSTKTSPQMQAQVSYTAGGFKGWLGGKTQKFESTTAGVSDFTMSGVEVGASYTDGPFGVVANYQSGKGLGILSDADQGGDTKSKAWFAQATYKPADKVKLGVSYGISRNDDNTAGTGGLRSNANLTLGLYYQMTSAITLVGEIGQTRSKGFAGGEGRMNGGSLGGIIFF